MGMSASQARFLALTARKSNVEFEGQQINQQRTTLSNESANYYSELCNMNVPTPPSVDDYTKVSYTFNDGALTNTITSMIAKGNNNYSISYIQQWQDDYSIVSASSSLIAKSTSPTGATTYSVGTSVLRELGTISDGTATYDATALAALSETDFNTLKTNTNGNIKTDAYLSTLTQEQLVALMKEEEYYKTMVNEKNQTATDTAWYVRYVKDSSSGSYVPYFYQKSLVDNPLNGDGEKIARGEFSIKDRSVTKTNDDREYHRRIANQLYKKWGEPTQEVISEKHYTIGII